ncbi:hypothetical protein HOO65_050729 [Ceratocystis lukuohia]|uniref:F-box domain-containing protein n=1 Tax=Ceratocystis lukuohia TaxID=2019550 RepID=A0ABR4MH50_9PEZI
MHPTPPSALPSSPFPILNLPLDIILTIASDHLSSVSALCLALTCKPLYHSLFAYSCRNLTSHADKVAFLTLLEIAVPNSVLCFACSKLHTCNFPYQPVGVPASPLELGWDCRHAYSWMPAGLGAVVGLSFRDARQAVLRAARAQGEIGMNGVPIPDLDVRWEQMAAGLAVGLSRKVAVIQNSLMARCTYTFYIAGRSIAEVAAAVETASVGLCQHVELDSRAVYAAAEVKDTEGHSQHAVKCCSECAMDYSVRFSGRNEKTSMEVITWHTFGSCKTPFEKAWQNATIRRRRSLGGGDDEPEAGLVRAVWSTASIQQS